MEGLLKEESRWWGYEPQKKRNVGWSHQWYPVANLLVSLSGPCPALPPLAAKLTNWWKIMKTAIMGSLDLWLSYFAVCSEEWSFGCFFLQLFTVSVFGLGMFCLSFLTGARLKKYCLVGFFFIATFLVNIDNVGVCGCSCVCAILGLGVSVYRLSSKLPKTIWMRKWFALSTNWCLIGLSNVYRTGMQWFRYRLEDQSPWLGRWY